jgi:sorbitol/mannitol transport system permease protein
MNPIFGLLSWIMTSIGLSRVDLLAQYPKQSIMAIAIWEWTPFMMLILLAGLQGIPDELREAARLDGATPVGEFRYVVLPLLGLYVELSIMLGTIYVLQIFGEIYVATQGGPGTATTTLPFYVFQTISQANDVGTSSAQGVVAVVVASIIAAILLRLLAKSVTKGVQA